MKLTQLRYLVEIVKHQHNISNVAKHLFTSQAGISKQIMMLETELNMPLFVRKGKLLDGLTQDGAKVHALAQLILNNVRSIQDIASDACNEAGLLNIATTHTQARYILPSVVGKFISRYPDIQFSMQQGNPQNVAQLLKQGEVDLAIATESLTEYEQIVSMPCYQWGRCVITRKEHPLAQKKELVLDDIIKYPLITYVLGFTGRHKIDEVFRKNKIIPNIVLTAVDADVIKTYVRMNLGIGIIAKMAYIPDIDNDLVARDVEHIFGTSTTQIAIRKNNYMRNYIYRFIELFAPHLSEIHVKQALVCKNSKERRELFQQIDIPKYH